MRKPFDAESLLPLRPLDLSVLLVLGRGDQYGYGLMKAIAERDAGAIAIAPGNLYQVLDRLIREGLVREVERRRPAGADGRRRFYAITDLGRSVAALEARRIAAMRGLDDLAGLPVQPESR